MKSSNASIQNSSVRQDVYTRVTAKVVADLEAGVRPWLKPWSAGNTEGRITLPLRHCGTPYRGINILLLWGEAMAKGYASNKWMTYRQAQELGAHVRKGEHGSLVVYADRFTKTETGEDGNDVEREIPFMKGYTVFNVEQIDGLPEHFYSRPEPKGEKMQLIEAAEEFFAASGATFRHGGNMAYYAPGPDVIQLPVPEAFRDAESYAATKAHELVHWTKHETRLARDFGRQKFGDEGYAREELVAELGAAFLCVALQITPEAREDHSAYIGHWLKVLKDDRRAIFSAAAHAQRAVDYLHGLQQQAQDAAA
jgi:antirestriction protein ArdC